MGKTSIVQEMYNLVIEQMEGRMSKQKQMME